MSVYCSIYANLLLAEFELQIYRMELALLMRRHVFNTELNFGGIV